MPYSKLRRILAETGIGGTLRVARERCGFSQDELATRTGMSPTSISHIEMGADFKTSTLLRLAAEARLEVMIVPAEVAEQVRAVLRDMRM